MIKIENLLPGAEAVPSDNVTVMSGMLTACTVSSLTSAQIWIWPSDSSTVYTSNSQPMVRTVECYQYVIILLLTK